jgi:hypothetical protein
MEMECGGKFGGFECPTKILTGGCSIGINSEVCGEFEKFAQERPAQARVIRDTARIVKKSGG